MPICYCRCRLSIEETMSSCWCCSPKATRWPNTLTTKRSSWLSSWCRSFLNWPPWHHCRSNSADWAARWVQCHCRWSTLSCRVCPWWTRTRSPRSRVRSRRRAARWRPRVESSRSRRAWGWADCCPHFRCRRGPAHPPCNPPSRHRRRRRQLHCYWARLQPL